MVDMCDIRAKRSIIQLLKELTGKIVPGNHQIIQSMQPFKFTGSRE